MAQRAIRFSETTDKGIQDAKRKCGFSSPTAFIRHAVEQELSGRSEELVGAEQRLAASIEQVRREIFRLGRAQQALLQISRKGQAEAVRLAAEHQPARGRASVRSTLP